VRILYHHRTRSRDGQRVHIDGLVGALRRAGHDVLVVGPRAADGRPEGGDPGPPRASALRELAELAYNGVERARLASAARDFAPEAVYARHALFCGSAVAFAKRRGLPVVVEVNAPLALERSRHGGLALAGLARRHETATLNRADRVVAVTRVLADLLAAQGVARERIDVHWNGLEPDALARAADGGTVRARLGLDGRFVLGFVGFVRDWNRLERAFPFLARRDDATLLVVGEGPDRARLETLARERGVAGRVRFLGSLPRDEVLAHVAAFDVALLPEVTEYASPLKLLDYLAAGRAVLAPDRANLREVVEPDRDALLFDAAAPEAFDAALERLAASPELREKIGAAGRSTLLRHGLTWDGNAAKVVARFAELRARGSGR